MPGMTRNDTPPVRRDFAIHEFKSLDDARGTFCGYLSVFGVEDQIWADPTDKGDIVEPGAFTKTLSDMGARQQTRQVRNLPSGRYMLPIFWAHDAKEPIGGFTMLREDAVGLYFEAELDMNIQQGQRAYSGLKTGYIPGMSFGYFAVRYNFDRVGRRHLLELSVFEGTVTPIPMNQEAVVLEIKSATDADKTAQAARAKKYGIAVKDGGNVTKPKEFADVPDSQWGDPVNYRYPLHDKDHADNAASRWGDADNRKQYSSAEQGKVNGRIEKAQAKFGEKDDEGDDDAEEKAVDIASDGSHTAFTGTHTHAHPAFGSQGDDESHSHKHSHTNDSDHHHAHDEASSNGDPAGDDDAADDAASGKGKKSAQPAQRKTFAEHYQQEQVCDLLEDWQDVVLCAFTSAVYDAFQIGDSPEADVNAALDGLKSAVSDWVASAVKYDLCGYLDSISDSYNGGLYRMQNGSGSSSYYDYMSLDQAGSESKAGRTISAANAGAMQKAFDMMQSGHSAAAKGMQQARAGHKAASQLLKAMSSSAEEGTNYDGSTQEPDVTDVEDAKKGGKSAAAPAPGAPTSDTTQTLNAEDLTRMIRERMATRQAIQTAMAASHNR